MSQKKVKQLKRELKRLLIRTPPQVLMFVEHVIEVHIVDGAELRKEYGVDEIDGKKVVDGVKYRYNYPVIRDQNFLRRLRRAFETNGMEGVNALYASYATRIEANNEQKKTADKIFK